MAILGQTSRTRDCNIFYEIDFKSVWVDENEAVGEGARDLFSLFPSSGLAGYLPFIWTFLQFFSQDFLVIAL